MNQSHWPVSFEALVRRHLCLPADSPLSPDAELTELGLDSLGVVALLTELEDEFEVVVPDDLLNSPATETPGGLWGLVQELAPALSGGE
ncbi:acyl carrier protein [Plantactinospora sp. S1510]|uniref:Acyl carrier protein n=1 Tax=Plantactinospora alkalitolerans TaxID=2789879 RepID=A0ABS0H176_9ACTN|nr:acyl carrier protein [Plantactinospora alkalitolerans]MBF9132195.1 acyl carrier protein [Plantactinospora alkalitolerans]